MAAPSFGHFHAVPTSSVMICSSFGHRR
jgi:hypothetical protein